MVINVYRTKKLAPAHHYTDLKIGVMVMIYQELK